MADLADFGMYEVDGVLVQDLENGSAMQVRLEPDRLNVRTRSVPSASAKDTLSVDPPWFSANGFILATWIRHDSPVWHWLKDKGADEIAIQKSLLDPSLGELVDKWNALHDRSKIPAVLYHYTTFEGLNGILRSSALWATFSRTLNDGSEWLYGRSVLEKYPKDEIEIPSWAGPTIPSPEDIFVTCFCEDSDLLSMWRSYSGHGGGFCLGFEAQQLDKLQRDNLVSGSYAARLIKVHYGESLSNEMQNVVESGGHTLGRWVLENMIKHEGFQEEKEWRIIVPEPPASLMQFRSSLAGIKPSVLIRHPSGQLPLRTIIYGPTLRSDGALLKSLRWMLEGYGYKGVKLDACSIPYRL